MQEINYRQEFPLWVDFYYENEKGKLEEFGFPPFDFKIFFWTTSRTQDFVASCRYSNGEPHYQNCRRIGDRLVVIFDSHRLQPGMLHSEIVFDVPSSIFPDGYRKDPFILHTEVKLIHGPTPSPTVAQIRAILPYIVGKDGADGKDGKDGKDFSYEELTEEQKEELAKKVAENIEVDNPEIGSLGDLSEEFFMELFEE